MNVIIYTQENGCAAVVYPASNWQGTLEELAVKDVPQGCTWSIVDETLLPDDYFFDAWVHDEVNNCVVVDITKARDVQMNVIRTLRDKQLEVLDVETLKGVDVQVQKQELRDIPQTFDLSHITSLAELKTAMPDVLKA